MITDDNYFKYIKNLQDKGWERENISLHENNPILVSTFNIKANKEGIVIDIICPPGRIIVIPGIKDFPEGYNIERIPYFELRLANRKIDDVENFHEEKEDIDQNTKIKLLKRKVLRKDIEICEILYRDISMINYEGPNIFKDNKELFRFQNMVELKGEDHLRLYVIDPDIDINVIQLNINVDLWTQNTML